VCVVPEIASAAGDEEPLGALSRSMRCGLSSKMRPSSCDNGSAISFVLLEERGRAA